MIRRFLIDRRGTTAVEYALVIPMFVLMVFAIIDFGWYFFTQHTIQYATREGVRLALVGRTIVREGHPLSREASIMTTIRENAAAAVRSGGLDISIYEIDADYSDPDNWQGVQDAGGAGSYMRVRTIYHYRFLTPVIGAFFTNGSILIRAEATYRNELFD
ncbi:MAG TPA: pilus assembly protein [Syntrophales bacterium]|jgi:Flp pilus assembly protein TadG|nr:pilus assembly protein [Syntrophales bacterium]